VSVPVPPPTSSPSAGSDPGSTSAGLAWPHGHFMGCASLDVWARLLFDPLTLPPPSHAPRLLAGLATSPLATGLVLPERLALGPLLAAGYHRTGGRIEHEPGAVLVLGYYRTGTTHLHYLLAADRAHFTPRWIHALAPAGFVASWAFLRLFLVPFMSGTRPQDDVPFGPDWPAEDEFAINNLALASSLPGRLVWPRRRMRQYARYDTLDGLMPREVERWRRAAWTTWTKFAWRAGPRRRLLLKTPSHMARLPHVIDVLGGPQRVRTIHLRRDPDEVVRSNVFMLRRLADLYGLERAPDLDEIAARVAAEYLEHERRYLAARDLLPAERRIELRYEDLRADPEGTMRAVYERFDLPRDAECERRQARYLAEVRAHRPNVYPEWTPTRRRRAAALLAPLGPLHDRLEHIHIARSDDDTTARTARQPRPEPAPHQAGLAVLGLALRLLAAAVLVGVTWFVIAVVTGNRYDWLAWPAGVAIGAVAAYRPRRRASSEPRPDLGRVTGPLAAILVVLVVLLVAVPNTRWTTYANAEDPAWADIRATTQRELLAETTWFWTFMGVMTAWRFGSRRGVRPPV